MEKNVSKQKYYIIDLEKVRQFMKERSYTNGELSEALGYDRRWLNQVYNRKRISGGVRIDIEAAQKMADLFGRRIQDIGIEGANREHNPIIVSYEMEAETRFDRLLPLRGKDLAELLRFIEEKDEDAVNDLMLYISDRGQRKLCRPEAGNQWIKVLYVSTLAYELIERWGDCWEQQDIVDKYQREKRKLAEREPAQSECGDTFWKMEAEIQIIDKIVQKTFAKKANELFDDDSLEKRASKACACFLRKYFEDRVTDPSTELQVNQYRRGQLS